MIYGIGVDLVTISRIAAVHQRFGERFERRILHEQEQQQLLERVDKARFLAKRFAVKEAAVKALGTGERNGVLLRDFRVQHDELGKPTLEVDGRALSLSRNSGVTHFHVSISDEGDQVIAFVVADKSSQP